MNIRGRSRAYNIPPVTEIGGDIYDRTTATDVSIIIITTEIPVATKEATTPRNRSTTILTRPTTSISSKI